MDYLTYKHSFNAGDLITVLPGIKHLYEKNGKKAIIYQRTDLLANYGHAENHPIMSKDGQMVCMNKSIFSKMKPLLEAQEYIKNFIIWEGQSVDFDFDITRHNSQMPLPGGNIHKWPSLIYPQLECDLYAPWLTNYYYLGFSKKEAGARWADYLGCGSSRYIVINRTERYQNPYIDFFFLRKYQKELVFLGTKKEALMFQEKWGLRIPFYEALDFRELASIIHYSRFFIGNQSFCWHIADAMKIPRILEVCSQYPNTFPTSDNGYSFILQDALEFHFHNLLNKTNAETA